MEDTSHFMDMLLERGIEIEWADRAIQNPDTTEDHNDGTRHFLKSIPECEGRWLRVVVNMQATPQRRVTAFFDRRLRRTT
ncbi:MAG: DUF4258 domain-containing protein [Phycisphaerae bacterium]|nr:DUF4258 domain-containing protein [Phycisphaerae bacterium]